MVDLNKLSELLRTQDNRITADPLFIVFEKRRISADKNFSDDYCWVLDCETTCNDIQELREWLRDNLDNENLQRHNPELNKEKIMDKTAGDFIIPNYQIEEIAEYEGFEKHHYQDIDVFVTACFTEEGAKDYLRQNQHNLTKPYIYVSSLYRNDEMIEIRNLLLNNKLKIKEGVTTE